MAEELPKPAEEIAAAPPPEGDHPPAPPEGEQQPVVPEGEQPPVPPPEGEQPQAPPETQPAEVAAPDGQHSWMVAGAVAWNIFCCSLLRRALPVMFYAVGDAFGADAKGSVAWMNAFIYSLACTIAPVVAVTCRTTPLRTLSVAGATLVGVGQIACFVLDTLFLIVPVVALFCGLGAVISMAVDETALHLHFVEARQKAASLYHAAFALSAILYPIVLVGLVETYGLNGALLVSGAISLNALAGSMLINRPVWMSATDPLPSIHQPADAEAAGAAALAAAGGEGEPKPEGEHKPEGEPKPEGEHKEDGEQKELAMNASKANPDEQSGAASGAVSGAPSGAPSGAVSVDPGTAAESTAVTTQATTGAGEGGEQPPPPADGNAEPQPGAPAPDAEKAPSPVAAADGSAKDTSVATILAVHCALTSLSVTASVVIYDYALDGDPQRSSSATLALISFRIGDLAGRVGYEVLLSTGEHRKVMAVQAFLMGGVLFLMALAKEVFLLAPGSLALGWLSSSLDMLPESLLLRFVEADMLERQLQLCRAASGVTCLLGPVIVMVFPGAYAALFIAAGLLSLLAGAAWLPGLKQEMDEAAAMTAVSKVGLVGELGGEAAVAEGGEGGGAAAGEAGAAGAGEPGALPVEGVEPGAAPDAAAGAAAAAGEPGAADPAATAPPVPV